MIKINSNIIDVFSKEQRLIYAKADNGAMYVSNGYFLGKISQRSFGDLLSQLDKRRRSDKIELVENNSILKYADKAMGNFEVSKPYEVEDKYGTACFYTDGKQYFAYNKKFLDVFDGDNRMFVDDNLTYDIKAHNLVVKDGNGEFAGLIMPLQISDKTRQDLFKALPLKTPWKTEYERIKENPTNG